MRRSTSEELAAVQQRVEDWRRLHGGRGSRGAPIPEVLWNAAVEVARVEGVYATAQALRFNHSRLQQRVRAEEAKCNAGNGGTSARAFVELSPLWSTGGSTTVIEIAGRHGDRMRVEVRGGGAVDVVGLVQEFWRREP